MKTLKTLFAAAAAVMMTFTALAINTTWQIATGQRLKGDGVGYLYQTYTSNSSAEDYSVDLGKVVSAFASGTLDLESPPHDSSWYTGHNGVKGPYSVVDGVVGQQVLEMGNNRNYYDYAFIARITFEGRDVLYISASQGREGNDNVSFDYEIVGTEYDATGGYKGPGYYRGPMPLQVNTTLLPNGMEMVAYNQTLSASGGTSPYTWSAVSQGMSRRANTWSEVATLGTQQEWYEDDDAWPLELPFEFPFYGETYTWIWISSNGNIYFTNDGETNPRNIIPAEYNRDEGKLRDIKMLSVYWNDSESSADHPIYTLADPGRVVVRFDTSRNSNNAKAAAELKPDGTIILRYSTDGSEGVNVSGAVGVSAGTGTDYVYRNYGSGELHGTAVDDIIFETCAVGGLPSGMALGADTGVLSGKPEVAGTYPMFVQVSDSASSTAAKRLSLTVDENPNRKPVVAAQSPAAEDASVAHGESIAFTVTASDPDSDALTYSWKVNGVEKSTAGAAWIWTTGFYDGGDYTVTCDISDGVWTVTATWKVYVSRGLTWYVNGTGGDDANTGYESDHPLKTISKALEKAIDGETILVAEGTYVEGSDEINNYKYPKIRVTDGRHLTIRATGARAATIIDGGSETSCLWLNDKQVINTNVVVEGFTLQNGKASWLTYVGAIGGGAFGGLLRNCTIRNCTAGSGDSGDGGGAAYARLENCTVTGCKAHSEGGALSWCDAEGCDIRGNSMGGTSSYARGCATIYGTLVNCLIADNEFESTVVGGSGAVYQSELYGCTVADNRNNASSNRNGAGVYGESSYTKLFNTIVFGNLSDGQSDDLQNVSGADLSTCCTNDPSFKNATGGDFSLRPTSVCHNAGKNSYVSGALDLAGKARIQEGTVDLGAYEYCPIMTITAAPTQATAGTAYSYKLTQTGGEAPVAWEIDDVDEAKNTAAEVAESSTFAALGEKKFAGSGGQYWDIDLPFAFPYGGTTYTRAGISNYGAVTLLKDDSSILTYSGHSNLITDDTILSRPVILPYLALNWGTYGEDGCGIFVDQSVPLQVTIRWATYYDSDCYRANFSMTLYANGEIRFSYGEIASGYKSPNVIGLSFGDGEHYLDMLSSFGGSNANDILFHPLAIPEGISLNGDQLVGMPTKGGTYRFRVTATEAGEETQSKIVTMDVLSNYTIHFDANGAKTGTAPDDKALTSIEEYILPEPGMTCGCARFLGWATNATGAAVYQPGDKIKCLTAEPDATVTLYAAWENIFVLQFDGNASGVIGAHASYTNEIGATFNIYRDEGLQTNIVEHGERYMPCRVGWFLDNWNMSADGSGEKFLRNATSSQWSQSVSSESFGANRGDVITLHAQWFESDWDFYWADPQLGGGKWLVRLKGDEGAKLWSVSGAVAWPESLTLPASYRGRTVSSLRASLRNMNGDPAYAIGQIIVPEGYTNLTEQAFNSLYHLESITFPSTLEVIPQYCCEDCTNLTSIGFSEGNRVVGYGAFTRCTALSAVELSLGLTNLEANAFYNCTNLTSVVLSPDYVGGTSGSYQFFKCPIAKLEIPASCQGFGYQSLNQTKALRFLGDLPSWNVYNANYQFTALIEYPATNTTWNAGPIASYSSKPHKGFVGPVAAFDVTDAYFWTNANETVTFAYAESPLAETVTLPEGTISWGGVDWEVVGFEPNAFAGQPTTTVYYPISEYAKWEQVTPPEGITLAPVPGTFFTLTFHVNGGDPFVPATMTFPPSLTRALPSAAPTRSAYKFLGWATTADGAAAYQPGENYTAGAAGGSATLYAKWEEVGNYTIHFDGNSANATGVPNNIVTAVGTTPAIPDDPEREGWTFAGWTNAVNATVYQSGDTFDEDCAKDSTFTLFAKWTEKSVSNMDFVDGDGSTWTYNRTGDSITITAVSPAATVTSLTVPTAFKGGTVTNPTFDPKLVYFAGAWLKYSISSGEATITGFVGTLPADLVIPSSVTAGGQSYPVTKIGDCAFDATSTSYENTLKSVVIPDSVKVIGSSAFRYCEGLETVSLGQGVERILSDAFAHDDNLAEIEFPSSLTNIGQYAFWGARDNYAYSTDGGLYADTGHTYLISIDPELEGEVVVADTVKITGDGACMNLKATSVVFPSDLEIFGRNDTFMYNSHTVAVTLPGSARLGEGSYTGYTTYIKTVTVMGAPPSWNLKDYFTGLTTVHYDARHEAEWSAYKAAYPALTYCDDLVPYATIAFDPNGGDGEMADMPFVECGVPTNLPACTLTRKDYAFAGWALEPEGEVEFADAAEITLPVECRKTTIRLFAQWTQDTSNLFDSFAPGAINEKGATYNGFLGEESLGGTFTLAVKKPKNGTSAATLTKVDPATGKKVKVKGTVNAATGVCGGGLAGLQLNAKGVGGSLGGAPAQGAVDGAKAKDAAALAVMNGFNKKAYGLVFADAAGEEAYLTATFSAKGKVKVAGTFRGAKVSGKAQTSVGDAVCAVPFVWSKKGVRVSFVLWFDRATRALVDVSGLGAGAELVDAGSADAGTGAYVLRLEAGDVLASVPAAIAETPLATTTAFNGKKFDAGKAAKVAYKKGVLTVDTSKGDNVMGLKLAYSKGALKGSFTVYAVSGGKLVKNKFKVAGVMVNGVGYAAGTNKKLPSIPLVLTR